MADDDDQLTPTEYLMMEVLAARYRLGEVLWTFPKSVTRAARRLETRRYVGWESGVVEHTIRVWLTDTGITAWKLDRPYPMTTRRSIPTPTMVDLPWNDRPVPVISLSAQEMVQAISYLSTISGPNRHDTGSHVP